MCGILKAMWNLMAATMFLMIILVCIITVYSEFPVNVDIVLAQCKEGACKNADAISLAYQLGRLDLVSVLLAITAIFVGGFSLFSIFNVERNTKTVAKNAVENFLQTEGKKLIQEKVQNMVPIAVDDVLKDQKNSNEDLDQTEAQAEEDDWGDKL